MKFEAVRRGLALMTLAFFLLAFPALAEGAPETVKAVGASINSVARSLVPGEAFALRAEKILPENADEPLEWRSSNKAVASVGETDGRKATTVTAIARKNSRAEIRLVGVQSGTVLARCQVTVKTVKITSMAIAPKSLIIAPGRDSVLSLSVKPSGATFKTVIWKSSNPAALDFVGAAVPGEKSAVKGEGVTVYARLPEGETQARVTVSATAVSPTGQILKTVPRAVTVKNLSVTKLTLPKSKTLYREDPNTAGWVLKATVAPALVGDELRNAVTYASSKPEVAEIDPSTGVLKPKATGITYVTASVGGKTSNRCKVTVASKPIKSLSISTPDDAPVVLDARKTAQLTLAVSPAYAADRRVEWKSDNDQVAIVEATSEGARVTAVSSGITQITARSAANAKVKATVTVRVRGGADKRTITITAAGDAVLGGDPRPKRSKAKDPLSKQKFEKVIFESGGDGTVFTNVAKYFQGENNITTLNLEGTLTLKDTTHDKKSFVFQGHPNWAKTMLRAHNIDAVCIANNHTYDVGKEGYLGTMRALDNPGAKIKYYGNGIPGYITKNGVKVAFVGFVALETSASGVTKQVKAAAKRSDMVVAAFHWTGVPEFRYADPTSRQKSLARAAIDAGADLVLGHHVHRLNGIERYRGKYIAYDLGNFVTIAQNPLNKILPNNPRGPLDYDSMIYQQKFHIWSDGFVEAGDITIIPCAITSDYKNEKNNAQPTPYEEAAYKQRVMKTIRDYSPAGFDTYPINVP